MGDTSEIQRIILKASRRKKQSREGKNEAKKKKKVRELLLRVVFRNSPRIS
jgi:hypothetical protein